MLCCHFLLDNVVAVQKINGVFARPFGRPTVGQLCSHYCPFLQHHRVLLSSEMLPKIGTRGGRFDDYSTIASSEFEEENE